MMGFITADAALPILAVAAGVIFLTTSPLTRNFASGVLSVFLDKYLRWRYPILSTDGKRLLPTCPYQWPNGQGDVAKFLEGIENCDLWEKEHGEIYRIWSGMKSEVVLTQPHQLQAVFRDSNKHSKAENNNSGYLMSELLGQCVGLVSRDRWRALRAVTEVPFQHDKTGSYVDMVLRHTQQHFDDLNASGDLRYGRIHPAQDLKMLPFWIVAEIFYGECDTVMRTELQELCVIRERIWKQMIQGGLVRWNWSRYLPTATNRELAQFKRRWRAFNQNAYERACRESNRGLPIVSMTEAAAAGSITLEQLYQTIDEALFANLDVTTGGISWNLVFLANHPEIQERLRSEILAAENRDAYLASSSTLLSACVSESSRLKPLAAFTVAQSPPTDRTVGGYCIPAGTNIVVDTYALNIRNEFWGEDRKSYRPDRFLEHRATELRYQYWRFGFGPRQCMGRYVADLVIRTLLAHLAINYELGWLESSTKEDGKWKRDLESWITLPDMQLKCVKRDILSA
ncbi:cytochrome P450 oxidoreductase GliC [Nannizzia gypsea CBS 118893]|uniref:Cytochrome P450 oxidoreductase GliC n=1 Tax=Arthroderma gypseum (strain ATCC MYA-4604 / CBS 118893) TaxID=535722 RepID=E4UMU6_ARTGP|nr:cytochrome P450 oxidoreductase GliC [Nannizzia gypsea CBS 118893]EFR00300.1 cytochrome P450 oxidoreductase GliC [Nannizzia gypsea CBS 118893]